MSGVPEDVPIRDETIRLGQLLKLAGVVETRRGRQLRVGNVVTADGRELRVVSRG